MKRLSSVAMILNLVLASSSSALELKRLDPHGKFDDNLKTENLTDHSECKVCHFQDSKKGSNGKFGTLEDVVDRCISCHNRSPHSGAQEHMGKVMSLERHGRAGTVNCMSCHRPHRALLHSRDSEATLYFKPSLKSGGMLGHTCVECHTWKKP